MNVLFFLTPKASCTCLSDENTIRQALERMKHAGYTALPIVRSDGTYCGTLQEGDLLRAMEEPCRFDLRQAESHSIMEIAHRRDLTPIHVSTPIEALLECAMDQNFVPVVDDRELFIGIVTRKAILRYFYDRYFPKESLAATAP